MTNKQVVRSLVAELEELREPDKVAVMAQFVQAVEGGYGEGDKILGVSVPDARKIAKKYENISLTQIGVLLSSKWHEVRLTAIFILVGQFQRASKPRSKNRPNSTAEEIKDFYLANLAGVNNWDLVDSSAHKILGEWLATHPKDRKVLRRLARSKILWEQRVAVIATLPLIRLSQFDEILELAEAFLAHPHDLMHKAVGWMLRETGKRNVDLLRSFLDEYAATMPRTMLRYSIEKLPTAERKRWLARKQ